MPWNSGFSSSEVNSDCGFHLGNPTPQEMRTAIYGWHLRSKCVDPFVPQALQRFWKRYKTSFFDIPKPPRTICFRWFFYFLSAQFAEQNHPHQCIQTLHKMGLLQQGFLCVVCPKYRHLRLFPYRLQGFLFFLEKLEKIRWQTPKFCYNDIKQ